MLWLVATLVVFTACDRGATKWASFFTIRPVIRESPPPCAPPALAGKRDGQAVGCYEVGPARVDAGDVASAALVTDRLTNLPAVEFTLSSKGVDRFNVLARMVGVGGRAAFVVDGVVVSAPKFETTDFPGKGVVTGLDGNEAGRLVKRLNRS